MSSAKQIKKKAKIEAAKVIASVQNLNNNLNNANINNNNHNISLSENNNKNESDNSYDLIDSENECDPDLENIVCQDSLNEVEDVEFNDKIEKVELSEKLCRWSINNNIASSAFNDLLKILNEFNINVPRDSRTIKKTPTAVEKKEIGGGTYIHYGLKNALTDFLYVNSFQSQSLLLDFNVDGLPLFKSSSKQAWPILGNVVNTKHVFLVGVFDGISKPSSADLFLEEFVSELNDLQVNGLVFNNKTFHVKMRCFIMDAPARPFILGTKGHTGYYSCVRCTQKGEIVKNRVVFPLTEVTLRNDMSFRNRTHPEFHNVGHRIALEALNIDMVGQISLDYMHIVCLGVVRTLLKAWVNKKGEQFSLPPGKIKELSNNLIKNRINITKEFNRKPRDIQELER